MMLGARVRALRQQNGWNQKQLAERSAIAQATISRLERGAVKELKAGALARLAHALGASTDYLIGRAATVTPASLASADLRTRKMLSRYARLSASARRQVADYVDFLLTQERSHRTRLA